MHAQARLPSKHFVPKCHRPCPCFLFWGCIPEEQGSKQAVDAILGVSDPSTGSSLKGEGPLLSQ